MPPIDNTFMLPVANEVYQFSLEPAYNAISSLLLLNQVEQFSGFSDWVQQTASQLGPEGLHRNELVLVGLHYAVLPDRSYPSFWAYLEQLRTIDPVVLRDRLVERLWAVSLPKAMSPLPISRASEMLTSIEHYFGFLDAALGLDEYDHEIESEAYSYMVDPPRMQRLIVEHLRDVWENYLRAEWERVRPLLQESVDAFRRLPLSQLSRHEVFVRVVGREPDERHTELLQVERPIIFVPSAHIGPYISKLNTGYSLILLYGARQPSEGGVAGSALDRSDLLIRLNALTDDTRLRMLAFLVANGERSAPEIMVELDLSQSAASRHLRQLCAAGYIVERWRDGSKSYRLQHERIKDTLAALERFFSG